MSETPALLAPWGLHYNRVKDISSLSEATTLLVRSATMPPEDQTHEAPGPKAKYCARCGARLEVHMRFCDQCGVNYEETCTPDGICHWCGQKSPAESEECVRCGARLISVCPQCGARMKAGLNYCGSCGLSYEELILPGEE
jgi:ribosomal protein L40E